MHKIETAICRLPDKSSAFAKFANPVASQSIYKVEEVPHAFFEIEKLLNSGFYVVAMISYEAAPAFDPAIKCKSSCHNFPLMYFAAYQGFDIFEIPDIEIETAISSFRPEISQEDYVKAIRQIKKFIEDGDTYQVNYTFRMFADKIAEPEKLFLNLMQSHPVPYAAFVNTGIEQIISLSPELFIRKNGNLIESRPMKGTAKRMPLLEDDKLFAVKLSQDTKNRAENVMIADMVRNDLGKICLPGSIQTKLFNIETYPSLHQLTSSVSGTLKQSLSLFEVFSALFPPASITGAPKVRTCEIISEYEKSPRKIYTGSIGCISPNKDFLFNVAIRTIITDTKKAELGIGSGIVADSVPEYEWEECLLKTKFYSQKLESFEVFETILWDKNKGFVFLDEHLQRMRDSQIYFCRQFNKEAILQALDNITFLEFANFARVKVKISRSGQVSVEYSVLNSPGWGKSEIRVCLAKERTDPKNVFLYHKTTNRKLYDEKYKSAIANGFDEIIFFNLDNQVTEGSITNIFIRLGDQWLTPPLFCGLLPGIWRQKTIALLNAKEIPFGLDELTRAEEILMGNSVRGGVPAHIELCLREESQDKQKL